MNPLPAANDISLVDLAARQPACLPAADAATLQAAYQGPRGVQRLIDSIVTQANNALATR